MDFTLWDVVRNLLTGLQWTLALSLVAFIGGSAIGLLVMTLRISSTSALRTLAHRWRHSNAQGLRQDDVAQLLKAAEGKAGRL